ncbi:hypothetical protein NAT51_04700 [Flavobacterium amniphilum]|uniref:hypothetical protein n=1 Tax=Flavobacterium amniphilum TaxID=1834035 RepID=UPI00202A065A|nr:hypothetical protein [Flavobacterium amniphilum]MCL9804805.1 hypothetical protein [Flavobacterium amniphilum]
MKKTLLFIFLLAYCHSFAQEKGRIRLKKYLTGHLSDTLKETSGLCFLKQKLYTFNDGGNLNNLYQVNPETGKINSIAKTELPNIDWEAITTDSTYLYLADFGNNLGTRKDLSIYKIKTESDTIIKPISKITFEYEEQKDFSPKNIRHNFDAEALIYLNGNLHLFSKEWKNKATSHYVINPNLSERQKLVKRESFKTKFVVTDASYFNQKLYLIGYNRKGNCFLLIFNTKDNSGMFFNNPYQKYRLGSSLSIGQLEGITVNEEGIYISGEEFSLPIIKTKPSLYFIPHNQLKE